MSALAKRVHDAARAYAFAAHLRSRGWTVLTNQTEVAE